MAVIPEGELPNFFQMTYTDKDGNLTAEASLYNDQLYRFLLGVFNSGITFPARTTAQITDAGNNTNVSVGTVWFNSTTSKLNVKTGAGTIEVIQSV